MGSREGKTYATVAATTKSYLTKWGKIHGSHFGSIKDQSFNDDTQPYQHQEKTKKTRHQVVSNVISNSIIRTSPKPII